jgi:sugar (pentulose or hexulose) kinase
VLSSTMNTLKDKSSIAVLDIGTSSIKCGIVDSTFQVICHKIKPIEIIGESTFCETDFTDLFNNTVNELSSLIFETHNRGYTIDAIVIVSQANSFVPVDDAFRPLRNGILWFDNRAQKEAYALKNKLPDFPIWSGLAVIKPTHYIAKILWLQNKEPDLFRKSYYFPLVNEFFFLSLTHKYYSEYSNRGMSCMLDIRNLISRVDVRETLSLSETSEPRLGPACTDYQPITDRIQGILGLQNPVPVYLAGNDQSASAIGAGVENPSDLSITFGTTQTFYTLTHELPKEGVPGEVYGKSPLTPYFFHVKFEENCGLLIEKLKRLFFPRVEYGELFETYQKSMVKPVADYSQLKRKIEVTDIVNYSKKGEDPLFVMELVIDTIVSDFYKSYLLFTSYSAIDNIYLSGGLAQSDVWCTLLSKIIERDVIVSEKRNAGLVGAAKIYQHNYKQ